VHAVPGVAKPLAGQLAVAPSQRSAGSQTGLAPAARQVSPKLLTRAMQVPLPLQLSGASQSAALGEPHAAPLGEKALGGQVAVEPVHVSAGSQAGSPPEARHTVVPALKRATHAPAPSQLSGASQSALLLEPQGVLSGAVTFAGHAAVVPEQVSAGSHVAFEPAARQVALAGRKVSAGQLSEEPEQNSVTSHGPASPRHTVVLGLKRAAPAAGTHTALPLAQSMTPFSQRLPVLHGAPGMQLATPPSPRQKALGPTCVPAAVKPVNEQAGAPEPHAMPPLRHTPASHPTPGVQSTWPPSTVQTIEGVTCVPIGRTLCTAH
jgi:hypothetical protein